MYDADFVWRKYNGRRYWTKRLVHFLVVAVIFKITIKHLVHKKRVLYT